MTMVVNFHNVNEETMNKENVNVKALRSLSSEERNYDVRQRLLTPSSERVYPHITIIPRSLRLNLN